MLRRRLGGTGRLAYQVQLVVQVFVELGHHLTRLQPPRPSADRRSSQPPSYASGLSLLDHRQHARAQSTSRRPSRRIPPLSISVAKCTCAI
jgi:hypothetical protein